MIAKKPFGRTGHLSTVTIFGAAALMRQGRKEADQAFEILLKYGVNHIDTAPRYGEAEVLIAPWMTKHRQDFFLATKTSGRTYPEAKKEIQQSLERLKVEQVDLIQFHALAHPDEWDTVMGPGGALEAAVEAREKGQVRFIGVTGHGWMAAAMHKRSLRRFDFDSILMPYNYVMHLNERYRREFEEAVRICRERGAAVQTIKSIARGPWGIAPPNRNTWYQPLEDQKDIDRAVHWVLGRGDVFLNTVGDLSLLPMVLDAASRFQKRPSQGEMEDLVRRNKMSPLFGIGT